MATTPVSTVTNAVDGMETDLLAVGAIGIGIGAAVFALKKGWKTVKSFI